MEMTIEQQRALALARARRRRAQATAGNPPPAGMTAQQAAERDMGAAVAANNTPERQAQRTYEASPIMSGVSSAIRGVPFVGEFADEMTGAVFGQDAMNRQRLAAQGFEAANPGLATALQIGTGVAASVPMAVAAGPAMLARAPASMIGRVAAGAGAGVVAGGTEGAVSGYGAGDDGNRLQSAGQRGAIGAAFGGVVGAAAPVVAQGVSNAVRNIRGRPDRAAAQAMGASPESAEVVGRMIQNDDPAQAAARIAQGGPNAMVADAGPATAGLLDTTIQRAGAGGQPARAAIEGRAADATADMTSALDRFLGRPVGVRQAARDISQRTSALRQRAYDIAYNAPIDYAGKGQAVEEVLSRVPSRVMAQAVRDANEEMVSRGVRNQQLLFDMDSGAFREMPNVQQLDMIKQALDRLGSDVDVFGRPTAQALMPRRLARQLGDAVKDAVPEYRRAVQLGGQKIAEDQALDIGRRVLSTRTTREEVAEAMRGASAAQLRAARTGIRQQIDDAMSNVRRAVADTNMDAREGVQVLRDLSSRANREKLRMVLGDQAADGLLTRVDQAARAFELRSATATNSRTFGRQSMDAAIQQITAPSAVGELLSGSPVAATRKLVQSMTNMTPQARQEVEERLSAEIARLLTERRGPAAQAQAQQLVDMLARQPATEALARRIGRAAGVATAVGGYQSTTRPATAGR